MTTINQKIRNSKLIYGSFIPVKILYKLVLGRLQKNSSFFISEKDYFKINQIGNFSILSFIIFFFLFFYVTEISLILSLLISTISSVAFLFVLSDYLRAKILNRHRKFDESAFLIMNTLSMNMISTQSLPQSIDLLISCGNLDVYYKKYFEEMIFSLNLGEEEEQVIQEGSKIFMSKKHQNAFLSIRNEEFFIDSDPDFLLQTKKEIKLIEDNIIIFIAVSCLLPLVLSLVLSFILPPNSPSIFIFPLLYALFGAIILRFIQNRTMEN